MSTTALQAGNIGFYIFHTLIIAFNMFGWIRPAWRSWHLGLVVMTALSWFGLGPLFGFGVGYCFCTDWHYRIRSQLGFDDAGISYIQLLARGVGWQMTAQTSNYLAYGIFGLIIVAALLIDVPTLIARARRRSPGAAATAATRRA